MDVLFDARLLHRPLSGLERVQRNLLHALSQRPEIRRLRVLVKPGTAMPEMLAGRVQPIEVHSTEAILRVLLDPGTRPDVYHLSWFPDATPRDVWLPLAAPASVVQVHDAILNRHPEYFPAEESWRWYDGFCKALVHHADALLCHSDSVAAEIEGDLDGPIDRAVVAPLAVEPALREPLPDEVVTERLEALRIQRPFFLMVGKDYPHKDHATALRALASVGGDARLVVAGSKVWNNGETTDRLLGKLRIADRVSWHQNLSDNDIKALMQGAVAFLYPSLEEGFGLPPIEAMALGTPVLAAAAMSIPEVCGDGAWLFPPGDHQRLAEGMAAALAGDPAIRALVERGRRREATFCWSRTAEGAVRCYQQAIANAARRPAALERDHLIDVLGVTATSKLDEAQLLAAWQERCRSVEHQLAQAKRHVAQLETRMKDHHLRPPAAPSMEPPPPMEDGPRRPRWSLARRLRKIRDGLMR